MSELGFVIETLSDGRRVKQRDNGLRGLAVADEAVLWDALQAARERTNEAVFDKFVVALEGTPEGQQKGLVCDLVLTLIARLKRELAEVRGQAEAVFKDLKLEEQDCEVAERRCQAVIQERDELRQQLESLRASQSGEDAEQIIPDQRRGREGRGRR